MKIEKLNQEKFEKIEKNELGKLVGGAVPGWDKTGKGGDGELCESFSSDYTQGTPGEAGYQMKYVCGGDITESQVKEAIK
jgi:hypothetical protein